MWTLGIGNNPRSAWFILVTISCIDSITQSDILFACYRKPRRSIPKAREIIADNSFPSESGDVNIKHEAKEEWDKSNSHHP
jgi:hypothetical protein